MPWPGWHSSPTSTGPSCRLWRNPGSTEAEPFPPGDQGRPRMATGAYGLTTAGIVAVMDFRIARPARDRYAFEESLFSSDGDAIVFDAARALSLAERFVDEDADRARVASEIAAIGLIHELGHRAVAVERRGDPVGGGPMARGLAALDARIGQTEVDGGLVTYESTFPALPVYRDEVDAEEWLMRDKGSVPGREAALEELALTSIAARNPAAAAYRELTSHVSLSEVAQRQLLDGLAGSELDADDPELASKAPARTLLERLLEPIEAAPQSLAAQLRWIRHPLGRLARRCRPAAYRSTARRARRDRPPGLVASAGCRRQRWPRRLGRALGLRWLRRRT